MSTTASSSEHAPITFTTTSTTVEPKKRGRAKKNASTSTTTTTNTTTITITPKFIEVEKSGHGDNSDDSLDNSIPLSVSNKRDTNEIELCILQEFILRYFDTIGQDGKRWFLTPVQVLLNKVETLR